MSDKKCQPIYNTFLCNRFIYISIGGKEDEGEGHIDWGNRYYPFIWNFTYTNVKSGFETASK